MNEFELIRHYFATPSFIRQDVVCGIGDDAALVAVPSDVELAVAVDTCVSGVHFPLSTAAYDIGYKALAVNLSDLAAMGATPAWMTLALTLPESDPNWLQGFSAGLFDLASQYHVSLIGGDTTRGPLTVTIQVHGFTPAGKGLMRSGARVGDRVYVSGTLGDAGLGLQLAMAESSVSAENKGYFLNRLNRPEPRVALGQALIGLASSAIDVSDGLLADLRHILNASGVGAAIETKCLPVSPYLRAAVGEKNTIRFALTAGDDYELCFTVAPEREATLRERLNAVSVNCTCIGVITNDDSLKVDGDAIDAEGYLHFGASVRPEALF